jgi:hypothetical protein
MELLVVSDLALLLCHSCSHPVDVCVCVCVLVCKCVRSSPYLSLLVDRYTNQSIRSGSLSHIVHPTQPFVLVK